MTKRNYYPDYDAECTDLEKALECHDICNLCERQPPFNMVSCLLFSPVIALKPGEAWENLPFSLSFLFFSPYYTISWFSLLLLWTLYYSWNQEIYFKNFECSRLAEISISLKFKTILNCRYLYLASEIPLHSQHW